MKDAISPGTRTEGMGMKRRCVEVRRELLNERAEEPGGDWQFQIVEHFRDCDVCPDQEEELRRIIRLIGEADILEMPAGFSERLRERIARI